MPSFLVDFDRAARLAHLRGSCASALRCGRRLGHEPRPVLDRGSGTAATLLTRQRRLRARGLRARPANWPVRESWSTPDTPILVTQRGSKTRRSRSAIGRARRRRRRCRSCARPRTHTKRRPADLGRRRVDCEEPGEYQSPRRCQVCRGRLDRRDRDVVQDCVSGPPPLAMRSVITEARIDDRRANQLLICEESEERMHLRWRRFVCRHVGVLHP
jgi:hypothetical protein